MKPYVVVQILDGGSFTATYDKLHHNAPATPFKCYCWCFHIYHPSTQRHIIWDVGLSSNRNEYTKFNRKHILDVLRPVSPRISVPEQLEKQGISRRDVDTVIFSHHHWDHSRPIKPLFPNATGLFGPGTFRHCAPGNFHKEKYSSQGWSDANFFHPSEATERCGELKGKWREFGEFEKSLDFFGDGSFWVIQAPGHMAGNLVAAAKVGLGDEWVILGGDCCHSRDLLDGREDFAVWKDGEGREKSLHEDLVAAKTTVEKLKVMESDYGCHIALAHDASWMVDGTDQILMSLLGKDMKDLIEREMVQKG